MSEEGVEKPAAAPKKSKTGLIIGIAIAVVTLVGGSVAGAVLGPRLLGGSESAAESGKGEHKSDGKSEGKAKGGEKEKIVSVEIPSIVVDLRDSEGRIRHLKVGVAAELAEGVTAEEFKLVTPRGREATLSYLRSLSFEEVADPAHYQGIREEISKRMGEAVGADRVQRVLLVDFVLQ